MRRGSHLVSLVQGMMSLCQWLMNVAQTDKAQRKADEMEAYMRQEQASDRLGNGRLADWQDIRRADLSDTSGLFLGAYEGQLLFFNGDGPLLTYLRTGGGKGRDLVLSNLAHVRGRSLIVIDVKDGENAYASHEFREELENHTCIYLNPFEILGLKNTKINPLQILIDIVNAGGVIETEAEEISHILLPPNPKGGDNAWVRDGAIRLLTLRMEYLAYFDQEKCSLGGLWDFPNAGNLELDRDFALMATCGIHGIERRAKAMQSIYSTAEKQFEAYRSDCQKALNSFEPNKTLARATSVHEFDFARLKHEEITVYLTIPSQKLGVAAAWISLIINYAIETIANEVGSIRTTLLLDEFPQLPPAPAIMKALRLYRGKGIQPWFFSQGRFSMEDRWSRDAVKEMEDQAAVMMMKYVQDPELIKDITLWSGNQTIVMHGQSHGGGKIETAGASMSEQKRAVLQSEDVLGLGEKMILKVATQPHLIIANTVPYYAVLPWKDQIKDVRALHNGHFEKVTAQMQ